MQNAGASEAGRAGAAPFLEEFKARLEQPGMVEAVPAHGKGWNGMSF